MNRLIVLLTVFTLLIAGCTPAASSPTVDSAILTSTTFLADIARNVAGDRVKVESLLPIGADPHSYQPTPQDAARIADSRLLIVNGMEYEHFIESLLENAGGERMVVTASDGIEALHAEEHAGQEEAGEGHEHEAGDPHMWLDPNLVVTYVENIRDGLIEFDPEGEAVYRSNAEAYIAELKDLDAWIVEQVSQVPTERRLLVTNHEALGYFAERYSMERSVVVAKLERPKGDLLDRPADVAEFDVFTLPEGVVKQEESAGENVTDHCLRAETDRQADYARSSKERCDIDAEIGKDDHSGNGHKASCPLKVDLCRIHFDLES